MSDDDALYDGWLVVLNEELQYSIWDEYKPVPGGWRKEGFRGSLESVSSDRARSNFFFVRGRRACIQFAGTKKACLDHIEKVWTDMRPKSLRDFMDQLPESEKFQGINEAYVKQLEEARVRNATPGVNQFRSCVVER